MSATDGIPTCRCPADSSPSALRVNTHALASCCQITSRVGNAGIGSIAMGLGADINLSD